MKTVEFNFVNNIIALNANKIINICLICNNIYINYLAPSSCESLYVCDNINQIHESLKYTKSRTIIHATRNDFGKNSDGFLVEIIISPTYTASNDKAVENENISKTMRTIYNDIISQIAD